MNPDYLSEIEKSSVIAFTSNDVMFNAVKKVLLGMIYHQGTVVPTLEPTPMNWAFSLVKNDAPQSDEELGQALRASVAALGYLNGALERLKEFSAPEHKETKVNDAV
jgi:hypothetical protein